ncbi:MAG: WG repeat-containing protein [Cytophagaceae bacterium]
MRVIAIIIPLFFLVFASLGQNAGLYPAFDEKGYYGYKNQQGDFFIKPLFLYVWPFNDGIGRVLVKSEKRGIDSMAYVLPNGHFAMNEKFCDGLDFSYGFAAVKNDSSWFYITKEGDKASDLLFDEASSFSSGFARVQYQGKWGVIDTRFRFVIPAVYDYIGWPEERDKKLSQHSLFFMNNKIPFLSDGLWGLADTRGKIIRKAEFHYISPFNEGISRIKKDDKWNYISSSGKFLSKEWFSEAYDFSEGMAAVRFENSGIGFINSKGRKSIPSQYDRVFYSFRDGLAVMGKKIDGKIICGIINKQNQLIVPFEFDEAGEIMHGIIPVKKRKWGFYKTNGDQLSAFEYSDYKILNNKTIAVLKNGKWGMLKPGEKAQPEFIYKHVKVVNDKVELIRFNKWEVGSVQFSADSLMLLGKGHYLAFMGASATVIDSLGNPHQSYKIDHVTSLGEEFYLVQDGEKFGVLSSKAVFILPLIYKSITFDTAGYFTAQTYAAPDFSISTENGEYLLMVDVDGKKVIEGKFQSIGPYSEGLFSVHGMNGLWGYHSRDSLVINFQYLKARSFQNGYALVEKLGGESGVSQGFINTNNIWHPVNKAIGAATLVNEEVQYLKTFSNLTKISPFAFRLKADKGFQLLDSALQILQKEVFSDLYMLLEEQVIIGVGSKEISVFSLKGVRRYTFEHGADQIFRFSEGMARIRKGRHYGFIDLQGRIRISPQYDSAQDFSEGLAAVSLMDKWGYIDQNEKLLIQPRFSYATPFSKGLAEVKIGNKWNFINKDGKLKNTENYDEIFFDTSGSWVLQRKGKYGLADSTGKEIINVRYDSVKDTGKGVIVEKDGFFGVLTYHQEILHDIQYDKIIFDFNSGEFLLMKKGLIEKFMPEKPDSYK